MISSTTVLISTSLGQGPVAASMYYLPSEYEHR